MRHQCWFISLLFFSPVLLSAQVSTKHSFDEIFPGIPAAVREEAFSNGGFAKSAQKVQPSTLIGYGKSAIDSQMIGSVFAKQPGFVVESIMVIPDRANRYSLLDVYNALSKIRGLKGRLYQSHTRGEYIPLFEDVTRIESAKKNNPIADPSYASRIPPSETIYMRLKDVNFGNSYYRGDMTLTQRGLRYSLLNNKSITYYLVPVIKEERFVAQFYFELIQEGILIYSIAGADVSDFISSKINMPSAISKRLAVIIGWVAEGITTR